MPMIVGTVSVTGGVASGTGLSKELYDAIAGKVTFSGTPVDQPAKATIADMASAIAGAVVAHIQANAAVTTSGTVPLGVAVTVVPATGIGATTAPGACSSTGTVA
jgi:hypothetical protein